MVEDHAVAQLVPQVEKRLAQAASCVGAIGAWPEQREDGVPLLRSVARGEREIRQQCQTLGLEMEGLARRAVTQELQTTQSDQPEHTGLGVNARYCDVGAQTDDPITGRGKE